MHQNLRRGMVSLRPTFAHHMRAAREAIGGRLRRLWPAHDPCPALARRQPTARPILCRFAARRLLINCAGRRRAGPKSRASRAVRVPRRCLWTWQDDPAARAMRGASGRAWSLLHGLACCPPAASPSQSSCLPSIISPSSHGHSQCPSDWPPATRCGAKWSKKRNYLSRPQNPYKSRCRAPCRHQHGYSTCPVRLGCRGPARPSSRGYRES